MAISPNDILFLSLFIITSILASFPFSSASTSSTNNMTDDYVSLLSLKTAILHDPFGALTSWNHTTHFCNWEGIRCSRRHPTRVVAIQLPSRGLVGSLSPSLGNMSFLRIIDLHLNQIQGNIPSEIGRLRRLEFINFSTNSFSGEVPTNLSRCSNLVYLNLMENRISGRIPTEFGLLTKLQHLLMSKNNFSGHIPPSIGNLTTLIQLSIAYTNLGGVIPESLGMLRNLNNLVLHQNNLIGEIPFALFNISSIRVFAVSQNHIGGSIPASVGFMLPNLVELYLAMNQFSSPVPPSLANATSLEVIEIGSNNFGGRMPLLGKLSHLKGLLIDSNPIREDIRFISQLVNCTKLERLQIGGSPSISGELPDSIGNLSSHFSHLMIQDTLVFGKIPSGIGNLIGLTRMSLSGNNLEGAIPQRIGELRNLRVLGLYANRFTGEIPYSFGNMTFLTELSLIGNQLSGSPPKSLEQCTNLLALSLSGNNLSGPIPPEIFNLSSLSIWLDLSYNAFTNTLPSEIGLMKNLANLDLSNNRLSGVIPNSLSSCTSLVGLYLEGNLFEGDIPQGLKALRGLQELDLSGNHFSGSIPSYLGELKLEKLNLSFNRLQGEVPVLGIFRNQSAISVEGNKDLCGGILELKLPPCNLKFSQSSRKKLPILLKILIPVGGVLFLFFVMFLCRKRTPKMDRPSLPTFKSTEFMWLSYADLLKATDGFSEANLLGAGRFGSVYKGNLNNGELLIAVKVLNLLIKGASRSFLRECSVLRHKRHRNLLKILSVCDGADFNGNPFKALVYEFKPHGSLDMWLHGGITSNHVDENDVKFGSLDIIQRLNIAIDIARGVEYLHCGTESTTVHGDLKPSNILLDHDMTANVGDFGLSKILLSVAQSTNSSIGIKGTIGYIPPEYGTSNLSSTQGDVYSYGILLLEIFTNLRPTDSIFTDQLNLHSFVTTALHDGTTDICEPLVEMGHGMSDDEKVKDLLASVLGIGVKCSKENPRDRMSMTDVVRELQKINDRYRGN